MDPARNQFTSRNGAGLRSGAMVEGSTTLVGNMAARPSRICPHGLGAACPLVEIVKGRVVARHRMLLGSRIAAVVLGAAVSVCAVMVVHG